jgi:hypothetical protein
MKNVINRSLRPVAASVATLLVYLVSQCASHAAEAAAAAVEMKLNWQVGKRYLMRGGMKQDSEITVASLPDPIHQQMEYEQEFAISVLKELAGGGRELEMEYTGVKLDLKMNNASTLSFDSKAKGQDDAANPAAKLRKLIGARIKYVTNSRGEVVEVKGAKELADGLDADNPQVQSILQGFFNEDSLKDLHGLTKILPPKPVKLGDRWPMNTEAKAGPLGTLVIDMEFTFKDWEQHANRKMALLNSTGTISVKPGQSSGPMGEASIESSKLTGRSWYDPAVGMVVDQDGHQEMIIKLSPGGQSITSKMKQDVTHRLVEVQPLPEPKH